MWMMLLHLHLNLNADDDDDRLVMYFTVLCFLKICNVFNSTCIFFSEDIYCIIYRWSISIVIPLHLHTDGDRSYSHLW